jgi:hypothetical protein
MGSQSSRTSVENMFSTHTDIDLEQKVKESCANNDTSTNSFDGGSGNTFNGGITQSIDSNFSCHMSTALDSLANSEITNEQFNKMKTDMSQTGVNLFQHQRNNQSARNTIKNFTNISQLQEIIKDCNSNKSYTNSIKLQDNNTVNGGVHQGISSAVDCVFETDASLEGSSSTSNTGRTDIASLMKQEGITMMASCGGSIVIIAIIVLFIMFSGSGKKNKR